jgi:hypothetical protein
VQPPEDLLYHIGREKEVAVGLPVTQPASRRLATKPAPAGGIMRPGRLRAQKATQELLSLGTCPLARFLHRPDRGGLSVPQPPATREPSPLAPARPLALRLLLGAGRTLPEVRAQGSSPTPFLPFFLFKYQSRVRLPKPRRGFSMELKVSRRDAGRGELPRIC